MKRIKHFLKVANAKRKNKEKNKNADKDKKLRTYSYKCGKKNIKLTVEKVEVLKESDLADSIFYYSCVFCNKNFDSQVQICPGCNRPLVKVNLKKCPQCGAKNNALKQACWVCGAPFPKLELEAEKEAQLLLTLNVDGIFYRNTDKTLGLGLKKLFADLISANFSKEPLETWVKIQEVEIENKKESFKQEFKYLLSASRKTSFINITIVILMIGIGLLIIKGFWSG
jgi:hypothetical protein